MDAWHLIYSRSPAAHNRAWPINFFDSLVKKFGLEDAQAVSTPFVPGTILSKEQGPATDKDIEYMRSIPYKELVGALLYAMIASRPDIAYPVGVLCKFMANPGREHWNAAKRVLRYLKGTSSLQLTLGGSCSICGFTDADYAGDRDDRKSTGTYIFMVGTGAVSWASRKQSAVVLSTLEAEYMAMAQATKEATWICRILTELGSTIHTMPLYGDNQGAIALSRNAVSQQLEAY